jgi:CubicO group peptidase (beta-lactamase class C family)
LTAFYDGADLLDPMVPGLRRTEENFLGINHLQPTPRLSGAGGLVTTLPDMVAMIRALLPGDNMLLRPEAMDLVTVPRLPAETAVRFPARGTIEGKVYSAAGAVTLAPSAIDPPQSKGEVQWGGVGGTHWWFSPPRNIAGIVMTNRVRAFWHPFSFELKRLMYDAVLD